MKSYNFINWFKVRVDNFGVQYLAYGWFGVINFPFSYFMWTYIAPQPYESLSLRLIAALFCAGLLLKKYWPDVCKPYFQLYWLITITYSAAFFGSFMLMKNNFSLIWQMNYVQALLVIVLLVSWDIFFICLSIGVVLSILAFLVAMHIDHAAYYFADLNWSVPIYMFIYAILIGAVFSRNKGRVEAAKMDAAYTISANIAHELRTPLASINAAANSAQKNFLVLLKAYELVQAQQQNIEKIPTNKLKLLPEIFTNIQDEVRYANLFIDMLLLNIQNLQVKESDLSITSALQLIEHALGRFPFDEAQEQLVHLNKAQDIQIEVVPLFFEHIIFNLIKNALYYIQAARKGTVEIWCELGTKCNYIHFKDSGAGINKEILGKLFERFFTARYQGTGVGLAFCKQMMGQFGGDITCDSVEGAYTHFILAFPILKSKS